VTPRYYLAKSAELRDRQAHLASRIEVLSPGHTDPAGRASGRSDFRNTLRKIHLRKNVRKNAAFSQSSGRTTVWNAQPSY
jgi:hypothetical protein